MEDKPTINKKLLLFWVRHGERLDQVKNHHDSSKTKPKMEFKYDPPLTENGKLQSITAGMKIIEHMK
jgi:hypothetical protein